MRAALLLLACALPALANREGWGNAREKAERLERRGQWAEAAAWWDAAAEVLEAVSAPLAELGVHEARHHGDAGAEAWWKRYGEEDARLAREAREKAAAAAAKATEKAGLEETATFLAQAIEEYPANYWRWNRVDLRMESLRTSGDEMAAWELEEREHLRWADRWDRVCVAYWKRRGDAVREAEFAKRAGEQRELAKQVRVRIETACCGPGSFTKSWEPGKLREVLKSGNDAEKRDAVSKLALRQHVFELREALSCGSEAAEIRAAQALVQLRDLEGIRLAWTSKLERIREIACQALPVSDPEAYPFLVRAAGAPESRELVLLAARRLSVKPFQESQDLEPLRQHALHGAVAFEEALQRGLQADYFASPELSGPAVRQTSEALDFDWELSGPVEGAPADGWSARFAGFLSVEKEQVVELIVQCDDAVRVRVDGRVVVDEWAGSADVLFRRAPLRLTPGLHSFVLEYADREGVAVLRAWLAPGRDEMVPLAPMLRRIPEAK